MCQNPGFFFFFFFCTRDSISNALHWQQFFQPGVNVLRVDCSRKRIHFMCKRSAFKYVLADWTSIQHIAQRAAGFGGKLEDDHVITWHWRTPIGDGSTSIWSDEPLFFAVQFRFPQTACIGTNCFCSAFSVQQCQLKPYSHVFNISFKTLGVCGERCRAGHSANQHVNAIEGSMNCSHSMCDTIHMTLEKKTHAPQLSLAHHVCIIIWVVFSLRSVMTANNLLSSTLIVALEMDFHTRTHIQLWRTYNTFLVRVSEMCWLNQQTLWSSF